MNDDLWPALPYDEWKDTYATLHMWTQVVGKVALALAPPLNHGWAIALQISSRGLTTRPLPHGGRSFTIEFDFVDHELVIRTTDGTRRSLKLEPRTVADFHRDVMAVLRTMSLPVKIWPVPVEIPDPIPFERDTQHHSYDPVQANRFWRILVQLERVLTSSRRTFVGKCSPVHFFWGSFDLAVTRFSGRRAPPREGPAFMREAYSHEVISAGFWPGGGPIPDAAFYSYAAPEPPGFRTSPVRPAPAFYSPEISNFVLMYEDARRSASPEGAVYEFLQSTYAAGANLGNWNRADLERETPAVAPIRARK